MRKPFETKVILQCLTNHLGVQFQYGEVVHGITDTSSIEAQPTLQAEDLQVMPAEWITSLYNTALNCSSLEVEELIAQIPPQHITLATGLQQLIHNYEFEKIMHLSKPEQTHPTTH
ncbi:MAG: hypothetical protein IGS48_14490 [Oscillatoriales cyanobacterium C42_A2020_001]|nr:hypothetical protein [Leptolyngbyaceae cyanobacterium C42_A2020_001]